MKEFIWHLRCMLSAKKYAKENEQCRNEYEWYKYLVNFGIKSFFSRLKFWKRSEQLPTDIEIGKMVSDLAKIADDEM